MGFPTQRLQGVLDVRDVLIDVMVPDIPYSLDIKIKRERYLAKQALQVQKFSYYYLLRIFYENIFAQDVEHSKSTSNLAGNQEV